MSLDINQLHSVVLAGLLVRLVVIIFGGGCRPAFTLWYDNQQLSLVACYGRPM